MSETLKLEQDQALQVLNTSETINTIPVSEIHEKMKAAIKEGIIHILKNQDQTISERIQASIAKIDIPENLVQEGEILTVGLVGFSDLKEDQKEEARVYIEAALNSIQAKYPNNPKDLISGSTGYGVPLLGYSAATATNIVNQKEEWQLTGISPNIVIKKKMKLFPVHERIIEGEKWGEDSETFKEKVNHILIKVGGGYQANHEAKELAEKGVLILEHELPLKKELVEDWDNKADSVFTGK